MTTVVASSAVLFPGGPDEGWLALAGGLIVDRGRGRAPADAVDLGTRVVAPGFVDLHCNGLASIDLGGADPAQWHEARAALARRGITSFCPTFVSAPLDAYTTRLDAAATAQGWDEPGESSVLGVHLEGPFLGGALGVHDPALTRPVDLGWLREVDARHPGLVRLVTLAPEADPGLVATRWLSDSGITVALGHTTATYDDALAAADAGATVVTHLFNGMSPWHHRAPGVAGAALVDERLTPTMIADLVHVHPAALRIAFAVSRVVVVSDAVATAGAATEQDSAARLPDGTLAGATVLLDRALANLVASGIPWHRAIDAITVEPAGVLGCTDRGVLEVGRRADIVVLDPTTLAVELVWAHGEEVRPVHH